MPRALIYIDDSIGYLTLSNPSNYHVSLPSKTPIGTTESVGTFCSNDSIPFMSFTADSPNPDNKPSISSVPQDYPIDPVIDTLKFADHLTDVEVTSL
ncbi:unnamed protein product, partial [Allacma fusca]